MTNKKLETEGRKKPTWGKFRQILATACLGPVTLGASICWTSPVLPQFDIGSNSSAPFRMDTSESSWVGSMLALGALTFSIPSGFLADRFGPKRCAVAFAVPSLAFCLLVILCPSYEVFCVGRFLSGCSIGAVCTIGAVYISEISDVSTRGLLSSVFEMLIYIGITSTALLGSLLDYLELTIFMGALTFTLATILMFFPESPTFLLRTGHRTQAEAALEFYRCSDVDVQEVLDDLEDVLARHKTGNKSSIFKLLLTKGTRRGLVACVGATIFQQLSAIDGITFYMVKIFQAADGAIEAYTAATMMCAFELISALFFMAIVEKLGRKTFLYISAGGISVCLLLFGIYFSLKNAGIDFYGLSALPMLSMFAYDVAFGLGLGPVPWILNGELFAFEIKGLASGITIAFNWMFLFIITKTFPLTMDYWGYDYTFYLYSGFMVVFLVFIRFCIPETKGKTLEQIIQELDT